MSTQDNHCKVPLASIFGKRLDLAFDGGILTSDSGALLLREVEAKTGILSRIIEAIKDRRHPSYVAHSVADLVKHFCVCFRSPAGMKMPMIVMPCAAIRVSRRRVVACPCRGKT